MHRSFLDSLAVSAILAAVLSSCGGSTGSDPGAGGSGGAGPSGPTTGGAGTTSSSVSGGPSGSGGAPASTSGGSAGTGAGGTIAGTGGGTPGSGGSPAGSGGSTAGTGGSQGGSAPGGTCAPAPKGSFTFHVRNAGTKPLVFTFGCIDKPRTYVETPDGLLRVWMGNDDSAHLVDVDPTARSYRTCENLYAGKPAPFFSDCGPGYGKTLAPGETLDLAWDRRGYVTRPIDRRCANPAPVACKFDVECFSSTCRTGVCEEVCVQDIEVAPSKTQSGLLAICDETYGVSGYCKTSRKLTFTIDTTSDEAIVDAK